MHTALFTKAAAVGGFHKTRGGGAQKSIVGGWRLESRSRISFKATFGSKKLIARCNNTTTAAAGSNVGDQAGGGGGVQEDIEVEALSMGSFPLLKYTSQSDGKEIKGTIRILGLAALTFLVSKEASTRLAKDFWALTRGFWALVIGVWALRKGGFWALIIAVWALGKGRKKLALMEE